MTESTGPEMDEAAELALNGFGSPGRSPCPYYRTSAKFVMARNHICDPCVNTKCDVVGRYVTAEPGYLIAVMTNEVSDVGLHRH